MANTSSIVTGETPSRSAGGAPDAVLACACCERVVQFALGARVPQLDCTRKVCSRSNAPVVVLSRAPHFQAHVPGPLRRRVLLVCTSAPPQVLFRGGTSPLCTRRPSAQTLLRLSLRHSSLHLSSTRRSGLTEARRVRVTMLWVQHVVLLHTARLPADYRHLETPRPLSPSAHYPAPP